MKRVKKEFKADKTAIPEVHEFVKATLESNGICGSKKDDMILACDEAASNIVEHAFRCGNRTNGRENTFILALQCSKSRIIATFFDSGAAFDWKKIELPDIRRNLSGEKRGGYGVFLMRKLVDKIVYSARRRLNITRLVKEVSG